MSLLSFAEAFEQLTINEQALFETVTQRLFTCGSLWKEGEQERLYYDFLSKRQDMIRIFIACIGWELHHHEQHKIFYITHQGGSNRYDFTADQMRLLLLLRLLFARFLEQSSENKLISHTRYPTTTANDIAQQFFSLYGKHISRTALKDDMRLLARFKFLRLSWNGTQRDIGSANVELLPMLEVLIPSERFADISKNWMNSDEQLE